MDAFKFAVRYARPLRRLPTLPFFFDCALRAWTAVRHPRTTDALDNIECEVLSWPGVTRTLHRFGGLEFRLDNHEIGHLHGHGLLDIPLTKSLREQLVSEGRARPHHIYPRSGWISYYIHAGTDVAGALALLRLAYERWNENRPAGTFMTGEV